MDSQSTFCDQQTTVCVPLRKKTKKRQQEGAAFVILTSFMDVKNIKKNHLPAT